MKFAMWFLGVAILVHAFVSSIQPVQAQVDSLFSDIQSKLDDLGSKLNDLDSKLGFLRSSQPEPWSEGEPRDAFASSILPVQAHGFEQLLQLQVLTHEVQQIKQLLINGISVTVQVREGDHDHV